MRLLQLIITVLLTILRCTRGAPEELSKFHSDQPVVATDGSIDVNKIVGGTEATANEFPFIVSLQNYVEGGQSYRHFCGGSVYNQNYIITAAHCVTPDKLSSTLSLIIVAGDHDLNTGSYSEQIRVVKTIYLHPRYSEVSYANDIAVLELQSPLTFNQWVTPIAIATTDPPELSLVTTSGWGRMRESDNFLPAILRKVTISVIPNLYCYLIYGITFQPITDSMLCAGPIFPIFGSKGVCNGDSGGPLFTETQPRQLVGIVSWGFSCESILFPQVYSRVSVNNDFIISIAGTAYYL